jgi:hypothetical protein
MAQGEQGDLQLQHQLGHVEARLGAVRLVFRAAAGGRLDGMQVGGVDTDKFKQIRWQAGKAPRGSLATSISWRRAIRSFRRMSTW